MHKLYVREAQRKLFEAPVVEGSQVTVVDMVNLKSKLLCDHFEEVQVRLESNILQIAVVTAL